MTHDPDSLKVQIKYYLDQLDKPFPSTSSALLEVLERMNRSGFLTADELQYLKEHGINGVKKDA